MTTSSFGKVSAWRGGPRIRLSFGVATVIVFGVWASGSSAAGRDDGSAWFENHVRPLLVDRCLKCHGSGKAEAGLRLDSPAAIRRGGDRGPAVIAGDVRRSVLLQAVRHDGDLQMPPDEKLKDREIAILERWVRDGAIWPDGVRLGKAGPRLRGGPITAKERAFWSFQPILDAPPPNVESDNRWIRNDIDRFVLARLRRAKLQPRPEADKRTLLRRATFDLTGLPPTPAETADFLADNSPRAFARVVDRLLATRAYGVRWGRHWLDVVRYADTAGETADYPTPHSWKYRNWVIAAFEADKPYDAFLREQIAGDLIARRELPDLTNDRFTELMTATGFIAISRRFGFDIQNYHNLTIQDTLDTLGQSTLGLSIGCARCHDHKYDPINTADYYAWYGIFSSTKYSFPGSEERKRPADLLPAVKTVEATAREQEFAAEMKRLNGQIADWQPRRDQLQARLKLVATKPVPAVTPSAKPSTETTDARQQYLRQWRLTQAVSNSKGHQGFHLWRGAGELPIVGFNASQETRMVPGTVKPGELVVHPQPKDGVGIVWRSSFAGTIRIRGAVQDAHNCGDSVLWCVDKLGKASFENLAEGSNPVGKSQDFSQVAGKKLERVAVKPGDLIQLAILPKTHYGCDLTRLSLRIERVDGKGTWDLVEDVRQNFLAGNPHADGQGQPTWSFIQVPVDRGQKAISEPLTPTQIAAMRGELRTLETKLQAAIARRQSLQASGPYPVVYGATEQDKPAHAAIQIRGDKRKLGAVVPRRNLEILGMDQLSPDAGSGRLALADWLTRPSNPLTARVMANRIWRGHFGRGLVGTENDFGTRGERPTHPQLLDWLASRFRESGWSIKHMHRLIMNSAAYQQSSQWDRRAAEADPDARLLWRFNRRRLSAEEIRDSMLSVSGQLDRSAGGPHPFPAVETWAFTQHAPFYGVYPSKRRSAYLMQQRLKRHPFLALFDGADPNVSTARRQLTTVPTQALYLMNSPFVHEQAEALAARVLKAGDSSRQRLKAAFEITLGREPTADDQRDAERFLKRYAAAAAESGATPTVAVEESWSAFCRTLLTRNEFLFVN